MDPDRIDHQPAPLRLTLELRPDGAGMAGSLCDELGGQHPFSGWLGLLTLLEAARLRSQVRPGRQTGTELASSASTHREARREATTPRRPEMRAKTKGKYEIGKRFTIVVGVAAVGVMALGAQTATSTTGRIDRVPPDLQLLGPMKQDPVIAPGTDCGARRRHWYVAPAITEVAS